MSGSSSWAVSEALRIAFVIPCLGAGGAERVATLLVNEWSATGHDVTLVTFDRPGTEPVALAVGLATALELACRDQEIRRQRHQQLRQHFLDQVRARAAPVVLNGPAEGGLPHTLNLSFPGCPAEVLLMKLDLAGIACSTGSARRHGRSDVTRTRSSITSGVSTFSAEPAR